MLKRKLISLRYSIRLIRRKGLQNLLEYSTSSVYVARRYNSDIKNVRFDMESWVQMNLHDSKNVLQCINSPPLQNTTSNKNTGFFTIISSHEFDEKWRLQFVNGYSSVVPKLYQLKKDGKLFSLSQLLVLLKSYSQLKHFQPICNVYDCYSRELRILRQKESDVSLYQKLLEFLLRAETSIQNYQVCEALFSEYLTIPNAKSSMIGVGLNACIHNNNIQLAKELYIQCLKNPEVLPMGPKELHHILKSFHEISDISTVQDIFTLWLKFKGYDESSFPDFKTISFLHEHLRIQGNEAALTELLNNKIIKKSGYLASRDYLLTEYIASLSTLDGNTWITADLHIQAMLDTLKDNATIRKFFYYKLITLFTRRDDFERLQDVLKILRQDRDIKTDPSMHVRITEYFVQNGMLTDLLDYYQELLNDKDEQHIMLNKQIVLQFWRCAMLRYRNFFRDYRNEFRLIFQSGIEYSWSFRFAKSMALPLSDEIVAGKEDSVFGMSLSELQMLQKFHEHIQNKEIEQCNHMVVDMIRRNVKYKFVFYEILLKLCQKHSLPSLALSVDNALRKYYTPRTLRLDILWLKKDALETHSSVPDGSLSKQSDAFVSMRESIDTLIRQHRRGLDFYTCNALAHLSLIINYPSKAEWLLKEAKRRMKKTDDIQWFTYYVTLLKLLAFTRQPVKFLRVLQEWNSRDDVKYMTSVALHNIKSHVKYFERDSHIVGHNISSALNAQLALLKIRCTNHKHDALEHMKQVSGLLTKWIALDVEYKRQQRKSLREELRDNI